MDFKPKIEMTGKLKSAWVKLLKNIDFLAAHSKSFIWNNFVLKSIFLCIMYDKELKFSVR